MQNEITKTFNNKFITKMYGWMAASLVVSFLSSYLFSKTALAQTLLMATGGKSLLYGIIALGIEFLVIAFVFKSAQKNPTMGAIWLLIFAAIDGATMSYIFIAIAPTIIEGAFGITALDFGCMSAIGICTKKKLSWGKQLFGAMIGLIIAEFLEIWFHTPLTIMVMSAVGIVIFSLSTIYDTNRIVHQNYMNQEGAAIIGALDLYLDFINIFIQLVQILAELTGNRN